MRVLLLNWRCVANPLAGGAEVHVWKVFSRAVQKGWEVCALTSGFAGGCTEEDIEGVRVVRRGGDLDYALRLPWAYRGVARRYRPDVVVEFLNKLPLYGPLYVRGPLVCFVHHLFGKAAPMELGRVTGTVVRASEWGVPWVYRHTPVLAGSRSCAEEMVRLGLPERNVAEVPYGVDVDAYGPGAKAANPTILYTGRLRRYKGVDHLLRIVPRLRERLPNLAVHVVGGGEALAELKAEAGRLGLDGTVRFHGHVPEAEKLRLFQEAWVMAFPSLKEGFGLTVAEAALCGTPTVGYDVPGLCDAIEDGKTGLLVPYGNLEALEERLSAVLTDEALRNRLGEAARARYREFTWDRSAARMMAMLEAARNWDGQGWEAVGCSRQGEWV